MVETNVELLGEDIQKGKRESQYDPSRRYMKIEKSVADEFKSIANDTEMTQIGLMNTLMNDSIEGHIDLPVREKQTKQIAYNIELGQKFKEIANEQGYAYISDFFRDVFNENKSRYMKKHTASEKS